MLGGANASLVQQVGGREHKLRYLYPHDGAVSVAFHFIPAHHATYGSTQVAGRGINIRLAWFQDGLLTNDPIAFHNLATVEPICDVPVPTHQLQGELTVVHNLDAVTEDIAWVWLLKTEPGLKLGVYLYGNAVGGGCGSGHKQCVALGVVGELVQK